MGPRELFNELLGVVPATRYGPRPVRPIPIMTAVVGCGTAVGEKLFILWENEISPARARAASRCIRNREVPKSAWRRTPSRKTSSLRGTCFARIHIEENDERVP